VTRTRGPRAWRGPTQFKQKPQAPVLPKHINHPLSTPRHPTPPSPPPHSRLRPRCSTPHPQHRAVCCAVAGRTADSHVGTRGPARPTRHTSPGRFAKKVLHLLPKKKVLFNHRAPGPPLTRPSSLTGAPYWPRSSKRCVASYYPRHARAVRCDSRTTGRYARARGLTVTVATHFDRFAKTTSRTRKINLPPRPPTPTHTTFLPHQAAHAMLRPTSPTPERRAMLLRDTRPCA